MATRLWSVVFDANDQRSLASFWAEALGWRLKHNDNYSSVSQGEGFLPRLEFVPVPEPKTSKNRIHFDLTSDSEVDRDEIVQRLLCIGARHVDIGQGDAAWTVLADPEGNEFCVVPASVARFTEFGPLAAIAFDQADTSLGMFWGEAIGWEVAWDHDGYVGLRPPFSGPYITFGPPVAPKPPKNRIHFDLAPRTGDDHAAEVERLISLGARRIDIGQGDAPWVVLADPEGNEFCVLTPR